MLCFYNNFNSLFRSPLPQLTYMQPTFLLTPELFPPFPLELLHPLSRYSRLPAPHTSSSTHTLTDLPSASSFFILQTLPPPLSLLSSSNLTLPYSLYSSLSPSYTLLPSTSLLPPAYLAQLSLPTFTLPLLLLSSSPLFHSHAHSNSPSASG